MTIQQRITRSGGKHKRALGVQAILEWAFGVEKAQLELPPPTNSVEEASGYGFEYVLIQQARLGCQVDGGRYKIGSYTHEDAEVIAATLAGLPDALGGKRMAIRVAELARARLTPDWMPGAVPRCVPVETRCNQHGERAKTEVVGIEQVLYRGRWRTVEVLSCPVTWRPHPEQIAGARRAYEDWWQALGSVREGLLDGGMLREVVVTATMPKARPWVS
ncbi:MAG: hypothetical protein ACI92Z_000579 [Paracoccaceae bacterium]|jgi:hypothetical protein